MSHKPTQTAVTKTEPQYSLGTCAPGDVSDTELRWRITKPIIQPHVSIPYAIKHFTGLVQTQNDPEHQLDKVLARLKAIQ